MSSFHPPHAQIHKHLSVANTHSLTDIITPVITWYLGYLSVGINSSVMMYFIIGFVMQFYIRKKYPEWFIKYNYILAAAISGGTELLVFVTTFAVQVSLMFSLDKD